MNLTNEQIIEFFQYLFTRMDGAWFLAVSKKFGIGAAWDMDIEAWKQLSYLFGKKIRKNFINEPVWPDSLIDALEVFSTVMNVAGREVAVHADRVIIRTNDCETQKAIAKAGVADCGIVTVQTYEGIINGLFEKSIQVGVVHTKNLNHGDDCCEVVISKNES
jgi:hypothetical protein